jgi:hypothetical protein
MHNPSVYLLIALSSPSGEHTERGHRPWRAERRAMASDTYEQVLGAEGANEAWPERAPSDSRPM